MTNGCYHGLTLKRCDLQLKDQQAQGGIHLGNVQAFATSKC